VVSGKPSHNVSCVYRKTLKIGGENRAIKDRRRTAITKVAGRPIRGDVGLPAGTGSAAGNGAEYPMPTTQALYEYRFGNGAGFQNASAGSGLRWSRGPKDPKGS